MSNAARYIGRFAPSPTGPLHFGSLLAAAASYLQACSESGRWLLRIEDIDPPRAQEGAADAIIRGLEAYGFQWHGTVLYQSSNKHLHQNAVQLLQERGLAYRCSCSRRDLRNAESGPLGVIYPGTCRGGSSARQFAIRVLTHDVPVCFTDRLQGRHCQRLQSESGDFVVLRRDGMIAYHLAVVVDDAEQGITEVVRGIDLLDSTPRHIHLQQLLGLPTPAYLHIPVAENRLGQKLSKLTGAPALPVDEPRPVLVAALRALQLPVFSGLADGSLAEIWRWAAEHWQPEKLAGQRHVPAYSDPLVEPSNGLR